MFAPLDIILSSSDLQDIFFITGSLAFAIYILAFIIGRFGR